MKKIVIFIALLLLVAGCGSKDTAINTADKMIKNIELLNNKEYGVLTTSSTREIFEEYRNFILEDFVPLGEKSKENFGYMKELIDLFFENTTEKSEFAWLGNKTDQYATGLFIYKLDNDISFDEKKIDGINELVNDETEVDYYYVSGKYIIAIENEWLKTQNIDINELFTQLDTFFNK